ncbi:MAG: alpha/beta hydrolase, partial [Selenomonadaceae bacterium]|nr:alpha/beta hydrolase [Selenomonadaceae bacterium]
FVKNSKRVVNSLLKSQRAVTNLRTSMSACRHYNQLMIFLQLVKNFSELEKFDEQFFAEQRKIRPEPERWEEFMRDYMKFWNRQSFGTETFRKIKCPVLLMVGDEDDHAPVITVLAAHQMIENSRLCVVPKAWHSEFLDNYDVTATVLNQFIESPLKNLVPSKKVDYNSK